MICRLLVAGWLTLALLAANLAPAAEGKPDLSANAALEYWNGFAALPLLDEQQEKIATEWNTVPLDDTALKVIEASRASLLALRRGAQVQGYNWGLHYEDGVEMIMPHLPKARRMTQLAGLRARYELEQGNYRAAVDDVIASSILARRAGADSPLIALLVQHAMERPMLELLAGYLTKMDADTLKHLASSLDALPAGGSLQNSLAISEKQLVIAWLSKELKEGNERNWKDTFMKVASAEDKEGRAVVQAALQAAGAPLTLEWKAKLLEDLGNHYDELLKLLNLPPDQVASQFAALHQKIKTSNPVAGLLVPRLDKAYERDLQARTQLTLFRAAVAIALEGADKVKEFQDATGKAPFEYRPLPNGFELRSKVIIKDQPVTLLVGRARN
jgi:hypothetical protein